MKNTEEKIKNAFTKITPDILESVIEDSDKTKGTVFTMKKQKRFPLAAIATAAAIVLIFGAAFGIFTYLGNNAVASVVSIDVNPGIELSLNKHEKVVEVTALNEDGKKIIGDMNLEGSDVDIAVNALIGSMLVNGYDPANSILISVDCDDDAKGKTIRERLMTAVNNKIADEGKTDASVITQKVDKNNSEAEQIAKDNKISKGKAQLIAALCKQNSAYDAAQLSKLSINELMMLVESNGTEVKGETTGNANEKAYITADTAKANALSHVSVTESDIVGMVEVSMDYHNGIMVYDVEFSTAETEYEIEVNAVDGKIVNVEKEDNDDIQSDASLEKEIISPEAVADIVLTYCADRTAWNDYECELDHNHGKLVYEVELNYEKLEYEFIIDALTGEVVRYKTDRYDHDDDNDYRPNKNETSSAPADTSTVPAPTGITKEQAIALAYEKAGVTEEDVFGLEVELDIDDGVKKYEIEFRSGKYEFSMDVNAETGKITDYEKEIDD